MGSAESPKNMKAAVISEFQKPVQIVTQPVPSPAADQLLVKVTSSSLCNSDLAAWLGHVGARTPYCPGHEPVGIIESVGSATRGFQPGDRVGFMPHSQTCMECPECVSGQHRYCEKKTCVGFHVPWGGFSQYCLADPISTVKLPDGLKDEWAAPLLCAGVTAYGAIKKAAVVVPGGMTLNVIGCGGVGHLVIQYAKAMGYRVRGFDISPDKLSLATHSGAFETHRSDQLSPKDKAQTKALQARATIVASGSPAAYELAFPLTATHGRVIAVGVSKDTVPVNLLEMVTRDLSLVATNQGSRQELAECLEIAAATGDIRPVVEMRGFGELEEGFRHMAAGKVSGRLVYRLWE
ncbi:hypothetical protein ETB97_007002 [Aspergillus alliaceus]|uniref:Enoyl reductase (ER) domain-containing protein n=1 Tax=Petromyces alliaceus TaxID=209559 RepID=A0A8H5ZWV1_PETAA|nr:hypothetical protein ETB97_007002 [Aspergillus burnettii]